MSNLYFLRSINGFYPILGVVGHSPALKSSLEHSPRSHGPSEQMRKNGFNEIYFIQPILGAMLYLAPGGVLLAENEK